MCRVCASILYSILHYAHSCMCVCVDVYEVGVHIADVSYFVKPGTALDRVASNRATTTYLVHKVSYTLYLVITGGVLCVSIEAFLRTCADFT